MSAFFEQFDFDGAINFFSATTRTDSARTILDMQFNDDNFFRTNIEIIH